MHITGLENDGVSSMPVRSKKEIVVSTPARFKEGGVA